MWVSGAGHGSQAQDTMGEETDGLSETILPCDFKTAGQLHDAELNRLLINPLIAVSSAARLSTCFALDYTPVGHLAERRMCAEGCAPLTGRLWVVQGVRLHAVIDACHSGAAPATAVTAAAVPGT